MSCDNLLNWLDVVVGQLSNIATVRVLGGEQAGIHLRGFYQLLTQKQVDILEARLANHIAWNQVVGANQHSAGRYIVVSKDTGELLRMTNMALGVFQTTGRL